MKRQFAFLAVLLFTVTIFAQSPEKMSYQAVIRNNGNELVVNQDIGMKISILQGSISGVSVYVETHLAPTNDNGLVCIEIGGGTVNSGNFSAIDWSDGPYFIKTETDPAGGTSYSIEGISQLLSVPYALHSRSAGILTGVITESMISDLQNYLTVENDPLFASSPANSITASNISNWNTAYGWGDHVDNSVTNEIQSLSINGYDLTLSRDGGTVAIPGDDWGTQTASVNATLTGNGTSGSPLGIARQSATTGQVLKWNGSSWTPGSDLSGSSIWSENGSDIYYNNGRAGIGTSSPATYMHLHGVPLASRGQLTLSAPPGEGTFISFYEDDEFKAYLWYDVSDEDLRLQNFTAGDLNLNPYGGRVGVGTNTPSTTLHVNGQIRITGGSPAAGRVLTSDANGLATWEAGPGATTYEIGDFAQGGVIFWLDETGQHGLVCAKQDQSSGMRWYAGTLGNTQAKGSGPFAGEANNSIIIAALVAIGDDGNTYAARLCNELQMTEGETTYGDWYLPSREELNLIYGQKSTIDATATANGGSAFANAYYWSSTEANINYAYCIDFLDGRQIQSGNKFSNFRVRAIRAF